MLLAFAELLGMSLWFSGSAVVPALTREWHLSDGAASWLTLSVQLGFVAGTLLSALLNLPDIISPRHLFTLTAIAAAVANGAFGLFAHEASMAIGGLAAMAVALPAYWALRLLGRRYPAAPNLGKKMQEMAAQEQGEPDYYI